MSRVLSALSASSSRLFAAALDFVAPPTCPACGTHLVRVDPWPAAAVDGGTEASDRRNVGVARPNDVRPDGVPVALEPQLCGRCVPDLAPPQRNPCRRCAADVGPYLDTSNGCVHCRTDRFAFSGVVALGTYANRLRVACLKAKRPEGASLAAALAGLLCERRLATLSGWSCDLVVPVPPFWAARLLSATPPATVMAEALARRLNRPCRTDILVKRRLTRAQSSLPATERRRNLRGAFSARPGAVRGRRVLLVDDVLTTGTTAHRCSRTLLDAGAEAVFVAVVARGLGKPHVPADQRAAATS